MLEGIHGEWHAFISYSSIIIYWCRRESESMCACRYTREKFIGLRWTAITTMCDMRADGRKHHVLVCELVAYFDSEWVRWWVTKVRHCLYFEAHIMYIYILPERANIGKRSFHFVPVQWGRSSSCPLKQVTTGGNSIPARYNKVGCPVRASYDASVRASACACMFVFALPKSANGLWRAFRTLYSFVLDVLLNQFVIRCYITRATANQNANGHPSPRPWWHSNTSTHASHTTPSITYQMNDARIAQNIFCVWLRNFTISFDRRWNGWKFMRLPQ